MAYGEPQLYPAGSSPPDGSPYNGVGGFGGLQVTSFGDFATSGHGAGAATHGDDGDAEDDDPDYHASGRRPSGRGRTAKRPRQAASRSGGRRAVQRGAAHASSSGITADAAFEEAVAADAEDEEQEEELDTAAAGGTIARKRIKATGAAAQRASKVKPGKNGRFACDYSDCTKSFRSKSDLTAHIRTHTGEKPLKCKVPGCGKAFAHSSNLRQHERSHSGEKRYRCRFALCSRVFAHPTSRNDHEAKHRGERPYKCLEPGCSKTFTAKANLTRHGKDIHKKSAATLRRSRPHVSAGTVPANAPSITLPMVSGLAVQPPELAGAPHFHAGLMPRVFALPVPMPATVPLSVLAKPMPTSSSSSSAAAHQL